MDVELQMIAMATTSPDVFSEFGKGLFYHFTTAMALGVRVAGAVALAAALATVVAIPRSQGARAAKRVPAEVELAAAGSPA